MLEFFLQTLSFTDIVFELKVTSVIIFGRMVNQCGKRWMQCSTQKERFGDVRASGVMVPFCKTDAHLALGVDKCSA